MKGLALLALLAGCSRVEPPPYIALDGDTISVGAGPHIRLVFIDAPELPGHCRPGRQCAPGDPDASRAYLQSLLNEGTLRCEDYGTDVYGRRLADCHMTAGHEDQSLSTIMLASGYAEPYVPPRRP